MRGVFLELQRGVNVVHSQGTGASSGIVCIGSYNPGDCCPHAQETFGLRATVSSDAKRNVRSIDVMRQNYSSTQNEYSAESVLLLCS